MNYFIDKSGIVLTETEHKAMLQGELLPGEKYEFSPEEQEELKFSLDGEEWTPESVERVD